MEEKTPLSLMALSAPNWVKRATTESTCLTSRTPFSLQNVIRCAVAQALKCGDDQLGRSNWASRPSLDSSVFLMEYWEDEKLALAKKIEAIRPDLLFIGAMTPSFPGAIEVAKLAKEILGEKVFTVIGGKHANETFFSDRKDASHIQHAPGSPLRLMQEQTINPVFDMVCAGRCEELILAIAEKVGLLLSQGKSPKELYGEMESLTTTARGNWLAGWMANGTIRQCQSGGLPLQNNTMPIPAELFGIKGVFDVFGTQYTAHAFSETSSGCSFDCFFCSERLTINGRTQNVETASERLFKQLKVIKETAHRENGTNSVSVFLEDSTFLGVNKKPDQLLRLAALMKAEHFTIPFGGQFTVDLLLDPAIQQALIELQRVGFCYVFLGMETESEDIAKTFSKNTHKKESWVERNERATAFLHSAGISYGIAVLFGLGEGQETRLKQLDQIATWQKKYNSPSVVSLNIATLRPLQKMDCNEDFTQWGVAADSPYLERFQRIFGEASVRYAYKRELLPTLEELREIEEKYDLLRLKQGTRTAASNEARHIMADYEKRFDNDFYVDDDIYGAHLRGEKVGVHFNSASIGQPFPVVTKISAAIAAREHEMTPMERNRIFSDARRAAACIAGLPEGKESSVIFGRNTTEAAGFAFWLAGLKEGDSVVVTDAENASVPRLFELHLDHGNPLRKDAWSTWPTHYAARGPLYPEFSPRATGVDVKTIPVIDVEDNDLEENLRRMIDARTRVFVCSHVLRDSGREMPVKKLCEAARRIKVQCNPDDPDLFILIDGAQALGNLPSIDLRSLGCDGYIAAPHKTMRSEVVGLLYIDPDHPTVQRNLPHLSTLRSQNEQVIVEGMFDERLHVQPNVQDHLSPADVAGFTKAVELLQDFGLQGNDFSAIARHREAMKARCTEGLRSLAEDLGVEIRLPEESQGTAFILPMQIPGKDVRAIAQELWQRGIFVSYIEGKPGSPSAHILRASFQMDTTTDDIDRFIAELRTMLTAS